MSEETAAAQLLTDLRSKVHSLEQEADKVRSERATAAQESQLPNSYIFQDHLNLTNDEKTALTNNAKRYGLTQKQFESFTQSHVLDKQQGAEKSQREQATKLARFQAVGGEDKYAILANKAKAQGLDVDSLPVEALEPLLKTLDSVPVDGKKADPTFSAGDGATPPEGAKDMNSIREDVALSLAEIATKRNELKIVDAQGRIKLSKEIKELTAKLAPILDDNKIILAN